MTNPPLLRLALFALVWTVAIYAINCLIAGEIKKIKPRKALTDVVAMSLLGMIGEVTVGTFYESWFGNPLWHYTVYPIHHAYTSMYAAFLWGIVGFHLYLLHDTLGTHKIKSVHKLALLFTVEAIILEALANITFKLSFGQLIYYYYPSDLWHYTSMQTLPFYFIAGYVTVFTFREFELKPKLFMPLGFTIMLVLVFLPQL